MKRFSLSLTVSALFIFCLAESNASAGFVLPRLPAPDVITSERPPEPAPAPGPSGVWTVTNNHDDGPGSLRHAISNAAAGDTIEFALPTPSFIVLRSSLVINKDLKILGPGPLELFVTRSFWWTTPSFRVFRVNSGIVTIAGMTILNGRALNADGASDNLGGGILNWGSLTVSNCVIARNEAPTEKGGHGFGGGIFSLGPLNLVNSTVRDNRASWAGGGVCTFHSEQFTMDGCAVNGNFAGLQGGGVNFQGLNGHIRNSTISGNRVSADDGTASGLLHIVFGDEAATLALSASTIVRNVGGTNAAIVIAALPNNRGIVTRMINTLVAENENGNFFFDGAPPLQSLGHNLDSDGTSGLTTGVNGNIVGTAANPISPGLGPLQHNGGPTRTHALLAGSPALDSGICQDAEGRPLGVDQRGFPRPQGPACDIGAFENQPPTVVCPESGTNDCSSDLVATLNDPDGDALAVVWIVDGTPAQTNLLSATHPPRARHVKLNVSLPEGTHTITIRVSDGKADAVECSTIVTLQDSSPEIIHITADPKTLWPPNHKLVPVRIRVQVKDCGPTRCRIVSVASNEAVGGEPDWVITGDLSLLLRAERSGRRNRLYTIAVECSDEAGNTARGMVTVTVPHGRDGEGN
jgi:hypothetical protein